MENGYLASGDGATSERSKLAEKGCGYDLIISTRPRRDLPVVCTETLKVLGIRARKVSIMWDERRSGWQQLKITTRPCAERVVMELARLLSQGESAEIMPIPPDAS